MKSDPLVTIVTPSLNMGRFIDATIQSVVEQDYPRIQYVIADGGSTDNTAAVVSGYGDRLCFISSPDNGQADAVNRTLLAARGEIVAFLNADDVYLPGAVSAAVETFVKSPSAAVVYGDADWIGESGDVIRPYPVENYDFRRFAFHCFICQPAAFIRTDIFRNVGGLDVRLDFAFDYDLWVRIGRCHPFVKIDRKLAASRMHSGNKTLGKRCASWRESIDVVRRHFGRAPRAMVYGYCRSLISSGDLFFSEPRPSRIAALLSLPMTVAVNWRRPH